MGMFFSDLYVNTVSRGVLEPGEQLVHRLSGVHSPWWAFGIPLFRSQYLVLVTDRRVVLARHKPGFLTGDRLESVQSLPYNAIEKAKFSGVFGRKLALKAPQANLNLTIQVPPFFQVKDSQAGGKALVSTWEQRKGLPGGAVMNGLPARASA